MIAPDVRARILDAMAAAKVPGDVGVKAIGVLVRSAAAGVVSMHDFGDLAKLGFHLLPAAADERGIPVGTFYAQIGKGLVYPDELVGALLQDLEAKATKA